MPDISTAAALARKYALQNAVQHGGKANPGAIVGKIMAEAPELRQHSKEIMPVIQAAVAEVNAMTPDAQRDALAAVDPTLLEKKTKERGHPFKPLAEFDAHDTIVMRFAPNPNGPATLGHSRGMVTMSEYKRIAEAGGKTGILILRFDDTDPQVKPPWPPAYDWLAEDYAWLGETPDRIVRASDRIAEYYTVAESLIELGAAYMCLCTADAARETREKGVACGHREMAPDEHMTLWNKMLNGGFKEGEATLRIKTVVNHKDPALRDWVAFRVATKPHPMVGDRHKVWPMLDFESAVEDHLQGVTHIIRGKDLIDSTHRQKFLYAHMGWTYPNTLYWGRVRIDEIGKFSSSGMRADIEKGKYSGWDDPRLPTLRAFRRRGFKAQAIRNFWVGMGLSEKDVAASLVNLYAESAKLLEAEADRYFFVPDPVRVEIEVPGDLNVLEATTPRHPDHLDRGVRKNVVPIDAGKASVWLARADLDVAPGAMVRLKDLGNLRMETLGATPRAVWTGDDLETARRNKATVVQWLPEHPDATVSLDMLRPEPSEDPLGVRHHGLVEHAILLEQPGKIVQFERYGYARLENVAPSGIRAVFTHR